MEEKKQEKTEEWESFVKKAKVKTGNHTTMVRFYNALNNVMILSVILLAGILTCAILLGGIGKMVLAALSSSCTVLTATSKFLVADRKKAGHKRFAKLFQTLLIRMLRCETLAEYNILWHELHEAIIKEPLVLIWQRRHKRMDITYAMSPQLEQIFEGKEPPNLPPQTVCRPPTNYRPNEFNPNDFHVMSINNGQSNQQAPGRGDGYVAVSGFHENQTRTNTNNNRQKSKEQLSEEKTPLVVASSKTKKKKINGEKSRQSSLAGNSSQGTLDGIEEEQGIEEQQVQAGRATPTSSKNFRSTMQSRNDRSIVYDEEEENELSEDTDDLDEDISYPRN